MLSSSYQENIDFDDEEDLDIDIDIYSTSLEEKSIIFGKIESELIADVLDDQVKFKKVLEDIKIQCIHKYYIKKLYNTVLLQLLKDQRLRYTSKMWNNFITSF